MALPNDKISVSLVASTLVVSETDVGKLCTHNSINKWSKWKPIRADKVTCLTDNDIKAANCGLLVYPATADHTLLVPSALMWFYEKPRGGAQNEPYRLGDFRNYNHEGSPVAAIPSNSVTVNKAINGILSMQIDLNTYATPPIGSQTILRIEDLAVSIGSMYYAIVFERLGQNYIKTATTTIGELNRTVTFNFNTESPLSLMSSDNLVFYNVLSNTKVDTLTKLNEVTGTVLFRPLPLADNADNRVNVRVIDASGVIITPLQVASYNILGPGTFIDIPIVVQMEPLISDAGLAIKCKVVNATANNITLPLTGWKVQSNPTYWGNNDNYFDALTYYAADPFASSILLEPQNEVEIQIRIAHLFNRNSNGDVVSVTTKETILSSIFFESGIYKGNTSVHVTSQ